jgi:lia operon protein LiaF
MEKKHQSRNLFWGIILIIAGALFLLQNAGLLDIHDVLYRYWPVILILLGLRLLVRKQEIPRDENSSEETFSSSVAKKHGHSTYHQARGESYNNVFGDVSLSFENREVSRFFVNNVFGGIDLNLGSARFSEDSLLRVNGVFGNVHIQMPAKVSLDLQANFLAGSSIIFDEKQSGLFKNVSYQSPQTSGKFPVVKLEISIVFGDIRITHS